MYQIFVSDCISYLNITALSAILFNLLGWQNQLQVGTRRRNHGSSVFEIFWQRQRMIDVDKLDVVFGLNFELWTTMSELEALWKRKVNFFEICHEKVKENAEF